jgi:hypothetical protein
MYSYMSGEQTCKRRTQYMHPTDPTCSNLDRRSLEVSVHLPGWDFAGGRVHTLPPGGALWTNRVAWVQLCQLRHV